MTISQNPESDELFQHYYPRTEKLVQSETQAHTLSRFPHHLHQLGVIQLYRTYSRPKWVGAWEWGRRKKLPTGKSHFLGSPLVHFYAGKRCSLLYKKTFFSLKTSVPQSTGSAVI